MAMDMALLSRLLEIEPPWTIRDCQWSTSGRRVELAVGVQLPKTWFGQAKAPENESVHRWRHINVGVHQCYIRAHLPRGISLARQGWIANGDTGFSHAMTKQIFAMLSEGVEYGAICNLLAISFQDLWKFKFALDSGKAGVEQKASPASAATSAGSRPVSPALGAPSSAPGMASPAGVSADGIPDVTDPVWQELAEGRVSLDIRMLSLKLLLTRVRTQMEVIHDRDVRASKLRELHRYFLKNERMLAHEIAQLHSVR